MKVLVVIPLLATLTFAAQRRYDGYRVFEVKATTRDSFSAIVNLYKEQSDQYDFWTAPRHRYEPVDIMVPPELIAEFTSLLKDFSIDYHVKIADVQSVVEKGQQDINRVIRMPRRLKSAPGSPRYSLNWESYSDLPIIYEFVDEIAAAYPDKVTVRSAGLSYWGNDMPLVKISTGGSGKNAIFVDGGIHAREWISPAFVTWLVRELVENYDAHPQYLDYLDWYIMPVINPDGYRHTFAEDGDRLWRKNRFPTPNATCIGVDLNRNFGFHFDEGGSSDQPCAGFYNGGAPFSEIEARNVRDAMLEVANQTKVYLTFHSYGQYWLTPWSYTADLPEDYDLLYDLGTRAVEKLAMVYGTQYVVGSATNVMYISSGGSDDWAKGGAGIQYSYTVEMRDTGDYGFRLPADQIIPNNLEVWEAVKVVAEFVMTMQD